MRANKRSPAQRSATAKKAARARAAKPTVNDELAARVSVLEEQIKFLDADVAFLEKQFDIDKQRLDRIEKHPALAIPALPTVHDLMRERLDSHAEKAEEK